MYEGRHQSHLGGILPGLPPAMPVDDNQRSPASFTFPKRLSDDEDLEMLQRPSSHLMSPGRAASIAPSLDLDFLSGADSKPFSMFNEITSDSQLKRSNDFSQNWFESTEEELQSDEDNDTAHMNGSSRHEMTGDSENKDEREDYIDKTRVLLEAKIPEIRTQSRAESLSGVLETFGITEESSDSEDTSIGQSQREINSSDDDEVLTKVVEKRKSNMGLMSLRTMKEPPRLDLELGGLGIDESRPALAADETQKGGDNDSESSSSSVYRDLSEPDDDVPLAIHHVHAKLSRLPPKLSCIQQDDSSSAEEDDDIPLLHQKNDEQPLGALHPIALLNKQLEYQKKQNRLLLENMQLNYQHRMELRAGEMMKQGKAFPLCDDGSG